MGVLLKMCLITAVVCVGAMVIYIYCKSIHFEEFQKKCWILFHNSGQKDVLDLDKISYHLFSLFTLNKNVAS